MIYALTTLATILFTVVCCWCLVRAVLHKESTLRRAGGLVLVAVVLTILAAHPTLVVTADLYPLFVGGVLIMLYGLWDDIAVLSWRTQLVAQSSIVSAMCAFGLHIDKLTVPGVGAVSLLSVGQWVSVVVTVLWVLTIMNAYNWVDGARGLSSGIYVISAAVLGVLALRPEVQQPPVAIIASVFVGAGLGLFLWNALTHKIMAGTAGAYFMGASLAVIGIFAGAKIGTTLMVLAIPLVDALWVSMTRIVSGHSPFVGHDARHLHDRLQALGWSPWQMMSLYFSVTAAMGALALLSTDMTKATTLVLGMVIIFCGVAIVNNISRRHEKI